MIAFVRDCRTVSYKNGLRVSYLNKYSPEYKSDEVIIKSLVVKLSAQVDM